MTQFVSNMPMVLAALKTAQQKALYAACNAGRNQIVKNISGSRHGRRYKVPGTQVWYTASAPGEYPAVRLGHLKGSIRTQIRGNDGYVGTDVEYALPLEKKPSDKGGREFMRPSLEQAKPEMLKELMKRWF